MVIVICVARKQSPKVAFIENDDVIEHLSAYAEAALAGYVDSALASNRGTALLPKRDRSRLDEKQRSAPLRPQLRENGPEQPVRRCNAWSLPLQPIHGELMT